MRGKWTRHGRVYAYEVRMAMGQGMDHALDHDYVLSMALGRAWSLVI